MRKLLLLLPLLALGAAAWWWWRLPAETAPSAHEAATPGPVLALDELALPVAGADGGMALLLLKARLELTPRIEPDRARLFLPRLQDACLSTLASLAARGALAEPGRRPLEVKRALRYAALRVLGPGTVQDVLLERSWEQPLR